MYLLESPVVLNLLNFQQKSYGNKEEYKYMYDTFFFFSSWIIYNLSLAMNS